LHDWIAGTLDAGGMGDAYRATDTKQEPHLYLPSIAAGGVR